MAGKSANQAAITAVKKRLATLAKYEAEADAGRRLLKQLEAAEPKAESVDPESGEQA